MCVHICFKNQDQFIERSARYAYGAQMFSSMCMRMDIEKKKPKKQKKTEPATILWRLFFVAIFHYITGDYFQDYGHLVPTN